MHKKGKIIVFEGIDQSGKGTQSRLFLEKVIGKGLNAEYMHFHDADTPLGKEIQLFLDGQRSYNPIVRQLLYTANRYERQNYIEELLRKNDYIIIDRYIPSGLAYGLVNGLDLNWMVELEKFLPQPDQVILIDISSEVSKGRKDEKDRDIYEKDLSFLEKVRQAYLRLAEELNWIVIDGDKSLEQVERNIWHKVWDTFKDTTVLKE